MINDDSKFIFVHIDKTAGSSITALLNNGKEETKYKHQKSCEMINQENKNYFKFCFVRNPYERAVSKYFHDLKISNPNKPGSVKNCNNFNEWILKHNYRINKGLPTQYSYVYDNCGNILLDYIGRFENLENDFKYIKEKLSIKKVLGHRNKNTIERDSDYMKYYTSESIKIVNKVYEKDFKYFNYEMKNV